MSACISTFAPTSTRGSVVETMIDGRASSHFAKTTFCWLPPRAAGLLVGDGVRMRSARIW